MNPRVGGFALRCAIAAAALAAWWWGTGVGVLDPFFFGTPERIGAVLGGWINEGTLWGDLGETVLVLVLGSVVGTAMGVAIGVALFASPLLRAVTEPYLAFVNGLPRLVFYPVLAVMLGFSVEAKVLNVAFVIVFLAVANTLAGLAETDEDVLAHARMVGANRLQVAREVYLPSVASWLLAGSRASVGLAFQAVIVTELIGSAAGLGHLAAVGQGAFDVDIVWAAVLVMVVVAVGIDAVLAMVDRRMSRWRITK
jgi:sulfonate transport system permease protein